MSATTFSRRRILWYISVGGLLTLFSWILYITYKQDMRGHGFVLGDWLTNFMDGGFKRRGLAGSVLFLLQDLTGVSLQVLVFTVQALAYAVFFFCLIRCLRPDVMNLPLFLLIWSPVTLMLFVNDLAVFGRKEVLLMALFGLYTCFVKAGRASAFVTAAFCLSLSAMTLIHEGLVFYIPYFILFRRVFQRDHRLLAWEDLAFLLSVAIPSVAIVLWSAAVENGSSLSILRARGVELTPVNVFSFDHSISDTERLAGSFLRVEIHYIWAYLYGMLLVYLSTPIASRRVLLPAFAGCMLFSLPLFYMALDWGRYLMIHFVLMLQVLVALLSSDGSLVPQHRPLGRVRLAFFSVLLMCNMGFRIMHVRKGFSLNKPLFWSVRSLVLPQKAIQ